MRRAFRHSLFSSPDHWVTLAAILAGLLLALAAFAAPGEAAVSTTFPNALFSDTFESGTLSNWLGVQGTGTAIVGAAAAHGGTHGVRFTNGIGQWTVLPTLLSADAKDSSTKFAVRVNSAAGLQEIAQARDSGSSGRIWELMYDGSSQRFYFFPYKPTGSLEIDTPAGSAPLNTWLNVEIRFTATASGGAQILVNGVSQGVINGDFSRPDDYRVLQLWDDAQNTTDFDDVDVHTATAANTAPAAPTGLTGSAGDASVTLDWTAPANNGGAAITSYRITPYIGSTAQTPINTGSTSTHAVVSGLTNNTAYTFTVAATNSVGTGDPSTATGPITPTGAATVPGAPTGVTAGADDAAADVSWTAPADNGNRTITGYRVTPYIGSTAQTATTVGATTSTTIAGLTNGTAYTFKVAAINSVGTGADSAASNAVTPVHQSVTTVFADDFETGDLSRWTTSQGNGGKAVGSAGAHAGSDGLTLTNTSGQYEVVQKLFSADQPNTTTTFWVRVHSNAGIETIAQARDVNSSARMWELLYDGSSQRFYFFPYKSSGSVEVDTDTGSAPLNTWLKVGITYTATATGGASISINGATKAAWGVTGDFTRSTNYRILQLWNDVTTSADFDDVSVTAADAGPTAPAAPTSVSAQRGNGSASLTWTAPSSDGGSNITGYRITPYIGSTAQTPVNTGSTATSYNVSGLTNGTTYTFTVAAINAIGTGPDSTASNAVVPHADTAPAAPTGVAGTRGDGQVALTWTAPSDNGGQPITSYRITPYIGTTAQTPINTGSSSTSRTITGLANGTAYTFTVAATNSVGTGAASAASAAVTPRGTVVPAAPTSVTGTAGDASVDLRWTAPSDDGGATITKYRITPYIGGTAQSTVDTTDSTPHLTVTGLTNGTAYTFKVAAINSVGVGAQSDASGSITPVAQANNPIAVENRKPGTTSWVIDNYNRAVHHEIEGYADATSVDVGHSIGLKVSLSSSAQYDMDVYRMGNYPTGTNPDGSSCAPSCGGRLMQHIGPLSGYKQAPCPENNNPASPDYGLTECNWNTTYTLNIPSDWVSGQYLVKLIRLDGSKPEQYLTFVVRDDASTAPILFSLDVSSWQAYNFWGGSDNAEGASMVGHWNDQTLAFDDGNHADTVSFDRPYIAQGEEDGMGQFMIWEFGVLRWLESQNYDVTYITDVDQDLHPNILSGHNVFVNGGHGQYYSDNMRQSITSGIAGGVNLALLSGDNFAQRFVFENDGNGVADRRIHTDLGHAPGSQTTMFRYLSTPEPENAITGVMVNGAAMSRPFLVNDPDSWVFAGTGLKKYTGNGTSNVILSGPNQNAIDGLIGYEFDSRADTDPNLSTWASYEPSGLDELGHSFVPASDNGVDSWADTVMYTAPSGATVFSAGTEQWGQGLYDQWNDGFCNCGKAFENPVSRQITKNIIDRLSQ